MIELLERITGAGIEMVPTELTTHFVFTRDGFIALVERTEAGFGSIGSSGLLTDHGLAVLIWRGPSPFFVARNFEEPATPEQVEKLRSFSADLESALKPAT